MASLYDKFMYPAAHEQKYLTRQDWATSPQMYHKEIMDDYVTNVSKNLSEVPYVGNLLAAGAELGAPIASATLSLPYDLIQSFDDFEKNLAENPDKYNTLGSTIRGIMTAIDEQNPLSTLWHRTAGSLQPIKRRITGPNYIERQLNWKRQQLMNQRKQNMQQKIRQAEAIEAAKQKVTTGGPPSILSRPAPTVTTGGPPSILSRPAPTVTTAKGPPSILSRPKTKPTGPTGKDIHGGGGGQRGSMPTGTAGRNPWGRADGGLINFFKNGGFLG